MNYLLYLAATAAVFSLVALSLSVMAATTNDIYLSSSGWFGVGAYLSAFLATKTSLGLPLSIFISMSLVFLAAWLVGYLLSASSAEYYALASFGVAIVLFDVFNNLTTVTRGGYGFFSIPTFPGGVGTSLLLSVILIATLTAARIALGKTPSWKVLVAIGDDIELAQLLGKPVRGTKAALYGIMGAICAVSGAVYAHTSGFLDPAFFRPVLAVYFVAMVAMGRKGTGSAILGATVFVAIPEIIDAALGTGNRMGYVRQLVFGAFLAFGALILPSVSTKGKRRQMRKVAESL